ncbi:helix-turn-helix domain-containing protein [Actinomadura parmotrematis]|uniref:Helix-turn-helix transcriptional regulator n=1 Tax=Actinomadura parmotrematis TaxID=2864039 RepID=A0ABS7FUC3_9ACTN|nr:helix-turn-helix transcriptional regulator [Actinomadura parmotrematis]MBW8484011.1 helix-turn-helix transcriptional regulator [Actinomadura parmotrematis]
MGTRQATPALRRFGDVVDGYRVAASLTRAQLAALIPLAPGYVGQILRGISKCSREAAVELDKKLGANGEIIEAWDKWVAKSDSPRSFADFSESEQRAATIRAVDILLVHGLFQTEDYARALLIDDEAVQYRMQRQALITRVPTPTIFSILDESTLYRMVDSKAIMHAQMDHLLELSHHDHIRIQVAPLAFYRGVSGTFSIATQEDTSSVAFIENTMQGETVRETRTVLRLLETFGRLQADALNTSETRELIRKVQAERWT